MAVGILPWQAKLDELQRRASESGGSYTTTDIPYYGRDFATYGYDSIEALLWEVSNAKLGELAVETAGDPDSAANQVITGASPLVLPAGVIDIVAITVDSGPTVELSPSLWFWSEDKTKFFSIFRDPNIGLRSIFHSGTTASVTILKECDLATWQSDVPILRPGYDEEILDEVSMLMELQDYGERA